MNISFAQIRFIHTVILFFFLACLFYALYSAIANDITVWTWSALLIILLEGAVLAFYNWQCPLTIWAEHRGAVSGSVADLFLPKYLADNLFRLSGTIYVLTVVLVLFRWLRA